MSPHVLLNGVALTSCRRGVPASPAATRWNPLTRGNSTTAVVTQGVLNRGTGTGKNNKAVQGSLYDDLPNQSNAEDRGG